METLEKKSIVERAIWETVFPSEGTSLKSDSHFVQVITEKVPAPHVNGILRFEFKGAHAHKKIPEIIELYMKKKLPFRWKTCSSTRPENIGKLLEENGMYHKDTLYGLISMPGQIKNLNAPDIIIKEVASNNLEDWLVAEENAWANPKERMSSIKLMMESHLKNPSRNRTMHYIAYLDDKPVATAGLQLCPDYGYLKGAAVAPTHRGKGVYKALLQHRIRYIEEKGLPTVNHCLKNTAAPICMKIGFEKVCEIKSYEASAFK